MLGKVLNSSVAVQVDRGRIVGWPRFAHRVHDVGGVGPRKFERLADFRLAMRRLDIVHSREQLLLGSGKPRENLRLIGKNDHHRFAGGTAEKPCAIEFFDALSDDARFLNRLLSPGEASVAVIDAELSIISTICRPPDSPLESVAASR
jgi:hypothetical protein